MGMGCMINKERCKMSEEKKHDYKAIISNDDTRLSFQMIDLVQLSNDCPGATFGKFKIIRY